MAARKPAGMPPLLLELERNLLGRHLVVGLEQQRVVRAVVDGEPLEVEITVRVRRHTGAAQAAELREQALAWLRTTTVGAYPNAEEAERCGCYLKGGGRCEGKRVVAVVVIRGFDGKNHFKFICGRHRETHGVDPQKIAGVVELPEHTLAEARDIMNRHRAAVEAQRKAMIAEHRQGAHGLLPAGIVLTKKCPECDDLEHELRQCRSHSVAGHRCFEDLGHAGPHRQWREEWFS